MERKIGEIFEYKGEWYQCVNTGLSCNDCDIKGDCSDTFIGACSRSLRKDGKPVRFKKLEKVGEPYLCNYYVDKEALLMQPYRYYWVDTDTKCPNDIHAYIINRRDKIVAIEIKNQEDMEEKKLNLKPFDIQKAREGKPVCTRDGRKARIVCFDAKGDQPIIALVEAKGNKDALIEEVERYFINGHSVFEVRETNNDLMMLPEKKEGWVNVYKERVYKSKEEAVKNKYDGCTYIDTIKAEWYE